MVAVSQATQSITQSGRCCVEANTLLVKHFSCADPRHIVRTDGHCTTRCQQCCACRFVLARMLNQCTAQLRNSRTSRKPRRSHPVHTCQCDLACCSSRHRLIHWRCHLQCTSSDCAIGSPLLHLAPVSRLSPPVVIYVCDGENKRLHTHLDSCHVLTTVVHCEASKLAWYTRSWLSQCRDDFFSE